MDRDKAFKALTKRYGAIEATNILAEIEPFNPFSPENPGQNIDEIFRNHKIGVKEVCQWWMYVYPEDVFTTGPEYIVKAREQMKIILNLISKESKDE